MFGYSAPLRKNRRIGHGGIQAVAEEGNWPCPLGKRLPQVGVGEPGGDPVGSSCEPVFPGWKSNIPTPPPC